MDESKLNKNNNCENIEEITIRVIKFLLNSNVPMEDIVHISGKTEDEINKIAEKEE